MLFEKLTTSPKTLHILHSLHFYEEDAEDAIFFNLSEKLSKQCFGYVRKMKTCEFWMRFASKQKLGELGEMYVNYWFKSQGFHTANTSQLKHEGDITATSPRTGEIVRFEVKTANRGTDNRWQFCLRKKGKTNVAHSDYVVFLVIDDHHKLYRYIVPTNALGKSCKLSLGTHPTDYRGKIAPFLMRDDSIDLLDIQTTYQLMGD